MTASGLELTFAIALFAESMAMGALPRSALAVPESEGGWGFHDGLEVGREAPDARYGEVR